MFDEIKAREEKQLPNKLLYLPLYLQKEIVCGYLAGDGHFSEDGINAFTISSHIAFTISQSLFRLGVSHNLRFDDSNYKQNKVGCFTPGTLSNVKKGYEIGISNEESRKILEWVKNDKSYKQKIFNELKEVRQKKTLKTKFDVSNNYSCSQIQKIREYDYDGFVYNIEVDEDNSYVANGIVVHNCMALTMGMYFVYHVLRRRETNTAMMRSQFSFERQQTMTGNKGQFETLFGNYDD